jgi:hypothetical protein
VPPGTTPLTELDRLWEDAKRLEDQAKSLR